MRLLLLTLTALLVGCAGSPDVFTQQHQLGKGINMGNSLEGPTEGAWGRKIEDTDFPRLKAAGFDSVRLPVKWSAHAAATAPYAIDPAWMARVDHVVRANLAAALDADETSIFFETPHRLDSTQILPRASRYHRCFRRRFSFSLVVSRSGALLPLSSFPGRAQTRATDNNGAARHRV